MRHGGRTFVLSLVEPAIFSFTVCASGNVKSITRLYKMKSSQRVSEIINAADTDFLERGLNDIEQAIQFARNLNSALNSASERAKKNDTKKTTQLLSRTDGSATFRRSYKI